MIPTPISYQWLQQWLGPTGEPQLGVFAAIFPTGTAAWTRQNLSQAAHGQGQGGGLDLVQFARCILPASSYQLFVNREGTANTLLQTTRNQLWIDLNSALAGPWADRQAQTTTWVEYLAIRTPLVSTYTQAVAAAWYQYREEVANALYDSTARGSSVSVRQHRRRLHCI